jgi:hypothetical protein
MTVSYFVAASTGMRRIVPMVTAGLGLRGMLRPMRIGEWNDLGRARLLLQRQLGELGAAEYAAHATVNQDNGRLRILVATDTGLLDYTYAPIGQPDGDWALRGLLVRWPSVRGLRLQTDAQIDEETQVVRSLWRLVAEEPKIELVANSEDEDDRAVQALLAFARACLQHAG